MELGFGAVVGAVYQAVSGPVLVIVPTVAFPFATPLTAQCTVVSGFPVLVTAATSWTIPPGETDDMSGGFVATVTPRMDWDGGVDKPVPLQLPKRMTRPSKKKRPNGGRLTSHRKGSVLVSILPAKKMKNN
jgi:hypothetical protein